MMKRYNSYKDSGVEWIGEIPSGWSKSKFKYLTTKNVQYGVNSSSDNYIDDGIRFIRTTDIDDFGNLKPGGVFVSQNEIDESQITDYLDFLVSRSGTLGRTYLHKLDEQMTYGGYLVRFNFGKLITSKFLQYYCYSTNFWDWISLNTIVSTIGNVNGQKYNNMDVPYPPLSEQQQIVSFLDTKTSLIDSLIEKTQQKIELLKEKKTSLINEVVTKGLNPNVEMKDSGVEWIGEIPDNWYCKRMCYMFKPVSIKNTSGEMNLSVYRDYGVIPTNSRDDNHNVISEDTSNYKLVNVGDFVMNKMKCWMGSLGLSDYRGIVSPSYTVMKPLTQTNRKYLHYLLRSQVYIPQYRKLSYGVRIGQWDLRFEDFRELPCLIPPLPEQHQIVEYLDKETQLIDNTVSIEEKRIKFLKEYRQSLISEVVTGKLKVVNDE